MQDEMKEGGPLFCFSGVASSSHTCVDEVGILVEA